MKEMICKACIVDKGRQISALTFKTSHQNVHCNRKASADWFTSLTFNHLPVSSVVVGLNPAADNMWGD